MLTPGDIRWMHPSKPQPLLRKLISAHVILRRQSGPSAARSSVRTEAPPAERVRGFAPEPLGSAWTAWAAWARGIGGNHGQAKPLNGYASFGSGREFPRFLPSQASGGFCRTRDW